MVLKLTFKKSVIENEIQRVNRKTLKNIGAYIRQSAIRSIKRPGKRNLPGNAGKAFFNLTGNKYRVDTVSKPGKPPRSESGELRKAIRFEVRKGSVVIGAALTKSGSARRVPDLLENGGSSKDSNLLSRMALIRARHTSGVLIGRISQDAKYFRVGTKNGRKPGAKKALLPIGDVTIVSDSPKFSSVRARPYIAPLLRTQKIINKINRTFKGQL